MHIPNKRKYNKYLFVKETYIYFFVQTLRTKLALFRLMFFNQTATSRETPQAKKVLVALSPHSAIYLKNKRKRQKKSYNQYAPHVLMIIC